MADTNATCPDERLPEPTQEQIGLALEIARRALDGERIELYGVEDEGSDNGRRLRSRPVNRGPIEEA
ncbi:hypothetical protein [Salinibacter phage 4_17]